MKYNAHKRQRVSVVWIWGCLLEAAPPLSCNNEKATFDLLMHV